MQTTARATVGVWILILVAGCASGPPTAEEYAKADYGAPIVQSDAEAKAQTFLKTSLKDPATAQYEWGSVGQGYFRTAPIEGGKLLWGYRMEAKINAKNSFGGYTGYTPWYFLFKDGELFAVWSERVLSGGTKYWERVK